MSIASITSQYFTTRLADLALGSLRRVAALSAITILAATLRFYHLGEWSLWIDEIYTISRALGTVSLETLIAEWWHPSISVILTYNALQLFGVTAWSARLVPALIGIISIPILYVVIRRMFSPLVALLTLLLLAVSPWHLEWSQNARYFTSLLLLYFLAAYVFFQALEQDRPLYLLLSGGLFLLAVGERFTAVFLIPTLLLYLLSLALLPVKKPAGFNKRNLTLILGSGLLFGLIELTRFLTSGTSYILQSAALSYSLPIDDPFRLGTFIALNIGVPVIALALFAGLYLLQQKNRTGLFILLNALVPVILLLLINPFYFTKDRYVFMVLPFWLILAAIAIRELFSQTQGSGKILAAGVLVLLLADAAGDNMLYYQINHGDRYNWKAALALIEAKREPGDVIVATRAAVGNYYLGDGVLPMAEVKPQQVIESQQRHWFITDSETVWTTGPIRNWMLNHAGLVEVWTVRTPEDLSLRLYLYDPAQATPSGAP